ncbi:unnamed protein product [Discosporangium mesarthrocarpum]
MLGDREAIEARWVEHFSKLLNIELPKLDPTIKTLAEQDVCVSLGDEPTQEEVVNAIWNMSNGRAMGPDDPPSEVLKLGLCEEDGTLKKFHRIVVPVCGGRRRYSKTRRTHLSEVCKTEGPY